MLRVMQSPTKAHVLYVAKNLREQEIEEIKSFGTSPVASALEACATAKVSFGVFDGDEPIAIVGLCSMPDVEDTGLVWMLTTAEVKNKSLSFVRIVQDLIKTHGGLYSRLVSFVDILSQAHQKFNMLVGFNLTGEVISNTDKGVEFLVFELITLKGLEESYALPPKSYDE